jgi:hypothetical protein
MGKTKEPEGGGSTALATRQEQREMVRELSVQEMTAQVDKIQAVMKAVMKEGEHYGVIPGTKKPSLLKPGAEKLGLTFRLIPRFSVEHRDLDNGHREEVVMCDLVNPAGQFMGQGVGSCSTMEAKYRWRDQSRKCPKCGQETIIKGKEEYGGGWLCFAKKGGCGAKYQDEDQAIIGQAVGRVENADIADTYNTVLKMGKKRAFVDATIQATGASDIFTQDVEDMVENAQAAKEAAKTEAAKTNGAAQAAKPQGEQAANGHQNGNGGNGGGRVDTPKPAGNAAVVEATAPQMGLIARLCDEKGVDPNEYQRKRGWVDGEGNPVKLTKQMASMMIDSLTKGERS